MCVRERPTACPSRLRPVCVGGLRGPPSSLSVCLCLQLLSDILYDHRASTSEASIAAVVSRCLTTSAETATAAPPSPHPLAVLAELVAVPHRCIAAAASNIIWVSDSPHSQLSLSLSFSLSSLSLSLVLSTSLSPRHHLGVS
jgi:hypothetical protein